MRRIAYVATGIGVLAWGTAEFFAIRFADMIWSFLAWATKGTASLPIGIVILLTLPPLGFATALCLSLSAIRHDREAVAVKISAISVILCALFVFAIIGIENSK